MAAEEVNPCINGGENDVYYCDGCDGKIDMISQDEIPDGKGICVSRACYDRDQLEQWFQFAKEQGNPATIPHNRELIFDSNLRSIDDAMIAPPVDGCNRGAAGPLVEEEEEEDDEGEDVAMNNDPLIYRISNLLFNPYEIRNVRTYGDIQDLILGMRGYTQVIKQGLSALVLYFSVAPESTMYLLQNKDAVIDGLVADKENFQERITNSETLDELLPYNPFRRIRPHLIYLDMIRDEINLGVNGFKLFLKYLYYLVYAVKDDESLLIYTLDDVNPRGGKRRKKSRNRNKAQTSKKIRKHKRKNKGSKNTLRKHKGNKSKMTRHRRNVKRGKQTKRNRKNI